MTGTLEELLDRGEVEAALILPIGRGVAGHIPGTRP